MEPVSAFATIVGLLASYKSERRAASDDQYKDFLAWLSEHRHEEILRLLEANGRATISLKALIHEDQAILLSRLESIDKILATIASRVEGVGELAIAVNPESELSKQALSILRQVDSAEASAFLVGKYIGGQSLLHLIDGSGDQVEFEEPRFLEDDLNTLVSSGLLIQDRNSKGDPIYRFTRQAANLVAMSAKDV